jgi:hypothetical protein
LKACTTITDASTHTKRTIAAMQHPQLVPLPIIRLSSSYRHPLTLEIARFVLLSSPFDSSSSEICLVSVSGRSGPNTPRSVDGRNYSL